MKTAHDFLHEVIAEEKEMGSENVAKQDEKFLVEGLKNRDLTAIGAATVAQVITESIIEKEFTEKTANERTGILAKVIFSTFRSVKKADERYAEQFKVSDEPLGPGEKVRPDDEGALTVACTIKDNTIFLDFGKKVAWLALDKPHALAVIGTLKAQVQKLK
ncbi:hypothetical protein LCGC14_1482820 [marine sediment metagenome]|uniref:Uncharacterized protein n=1 Tax=marine sediment metagenome TaxID=412755 RepID=A0A0F9MAW5_9ZZZZ